MDATNRVSLALHSSPGVYALLLGSGVSRAAEVPTGWEVTLDLIRRLAASRGHTDIAHPEKWFVDEFGGEPGYSDLLEELGNTPTERQALLREYFEPTDEEREQGVKRPTLAHHAIARLAADGFVRVILTTNFDRLMEQALDAAGVAHSTWASADSIAGGVPLIHEGVIVVKLHGDYRDTRLRNTVGELDEYDEPLDSLLDEIFDAFGLIVCGWSGVWDAALRSAITRAPSRRYRTFWCAKDGRIADEAQSLIDHRQADVVEIGSSDEFFSTIEQQVNAIAEARRPHPDSVEIAVATAKRLMTRSEDRIRLHDSVMAQAIRVRDSISDQDRYPYNQTASSPELKSVEGIVATIGRYREDTDIALNVLAHVGAWGDGQHHRQVALRALEHVGSPDRQPSGLSVHVNLRRLPALLCLYATGIGAVSRENWAMLRHVTSGAQLGDQHGQPVPAFAALHPHLVLDNKKLAQHLLDNNEKLNRKTPWDDWLHQTLTRPLMPLAHRADQYELLYDRWELLLALIAAGEGVNREDGSGPWWPGPTVGRLEWRHAHSRPHPTVKWLQEHEGDLAPALFPTTGDPQELLTTAWEAIKDSIGSNRW